MNFCDLVDCCHSPVRGLQERVIPSASPYVSPSWECRIVCLSCGRATPWSWDFDVAARFWNKKGGINDNIQAAGSF